MLKIFKSTLIALVLLPSLALAQSFEAGQRAYDARDYAAAVREWQPLAEQGNPEAQHKFGLLHIRGRGVPRDRDIALYWSKKAAEQGYLPAMYTLGVLYMTGPSENRDYVEAAKLVSHGSRARDPSRAASTWPYVQSGPRCPAKHISNGTAQLCRS